MITIYWIIVVIEIYQSTFKHITQTYIINKLVAKYSHFCTTSTLSPQISHWLHSRSVYVYTTLNDYANCS